MFLKSDDFSPPAPLIKQMSIFSVLLSAGICSAFLLCITGVLPRAQGRSWAALWSLWVSVLYTLSELMRSSKFAKWHALQQRWDGDAKIMKVAFSGESKIYI